MLQILIWGTGEVAESTLSICRTLYLYEIMGFIDNNPQKEGTLFHGKRVYSSTILDKIVPDKIVILTDSYDEIRCQILELYPELDAIIENKNFFYKESLLRRYSDEKDKEIIKVLDFIKKNGLDIFNYDFKRKYENLDIKVYLDERCGLYYVMHYDKPLYFSRNYKSKKDVINYYKSILIEQDEKSPHKYLAGNFNIGEGDVVIDVGAAEGNFSLEVIDKVSKLYIIEVDDGWIEALNETFREYLDKIIIIKKYVSSYNEGIFSTLDSLVEEPVDFIKMDIEGCEWDALQGAIKLIKMSSRLKCAICSYHSDFDQELIESFMDKHNLLHDTTKGYMWFPWTVRQNNVSTKLHRAIVRGRKIE